MAAPAPGVAAASRRVHVIIRGDYIIDDAHDIGPNHREWVEDQPSGITLHAALTKGAFQGTLLTRDNGEYLLTPSDINTFHCYYNGMEQTPENRIDPMKTLADLTNDLQNIGERVVLKFTLMEFNFQLHLVLND